MVQASVRAKERWLFKITQETRKKDKEQIILGKAFFICLNGSLEVEIRVTNQKSTLSFKLNKLFLGASGSCDLISWRYNWTNHRVLKNVVVKLCTTNKTAVKF